MLWEFVRVLSMCRYLLKGSMFIYKQNECVLKIGYMLGLSMFIYKKNDCVLMTTLSFEKKYVHIWKNRVFAHQFWSIVTQIDNVKKGIDDMLI